MECLKREPEKSSGTGQFARAEHLVRPIVADRIYEGDATLKRSDLLDDIPEYQDEVLIFARRCMRLSSASTIPSQVSNKCRKFKLFFVFF